MWNDRSILMRIALPCGPVMLLLACGDGPLPPAPSTTGAIEITTATVGIDHDHNGYIAIVDNDPGVRVPSNGRTNLTGLTPGDHEIRLFDIAYNCVVAEPERTVAVSVGGPEARVTVAFEITCAAAEKIAFTRWSWPDGSDIPTLSVSFAYLDSRPAVELVRGHSPSWSPDGLRIVYTRVAQCGIDCGNAGLSIAETSGGAATARELTSDASDGDPAWSPDGATIAFTRATRLYRITPSGGQAEPFYAQPPPLFAYEPAWSPDGTRLTFSCDDFTGNRDICVVNADGSGFQRLTNSAEWEDEPAWSPDGEAIAFSRMESFEWTVVVMTLATGQTRTLAAGWDPSWSPDGRRIVFIDYVLIDSPYEGPGRLTVGLSSIGVDGSGLALLTRGFDRDPAWRP